MKEKEVNDGATPPHGVYPMRMGLGFLVHDVARLRRTHMDGALRPLNLTRAQRWILIHLSQFRGDGVSQAQLAKSMHAGPASLGDGLMLLEGLGYVVRLRERKDRRRMIVRLTDAGYDALETSSRLAEKFNGMILEGAAEADIAAAERVLHVMRENLLGIRKLNPD